MTARERRLRERIDFVSDQLEAALADLWDARADNEDLERRLRGRNETQRVREITRSRDMWRERARNAEHMLNEKERVQRRARKKTGAFA